MAEWRYCLASWYSTTKQAMEIRYQCGQVAGSKSGIQDRRDYRSTPILQQARVLSYAALRLWSTVWPRPVFADHFTLRQYICWQDARYEGRSFRSTTSHFRSI